MADIMTKTNRIILSALEVEPARALKLLELDGLSRGNLYVNLSGLHQRGLIAFEMQKQHRLGRPFKVFSITSAGRLAMRMADANIRERDREMLEVLVVDAQRYADQFVASGAGIAKYLGDSQSVVSTRLSNLKARGLVIDHRIEGRGRPFRWDATDKGRALFERLSLAEAA